MAYIAVIGDMVASRDLEKRSDVQVTFQKACKELNASRRKYHLASPFTVTLGDEFQVLFKKPDYVWPCIFRLEAAMHPVTFRFSLGVGEITTKVNAKAAIGMDGPAFHRARAGIELLKERELNYRISGIGAAEALTNCSLALLSGIRGKWHYNRVAILTGLLFGTSVAELRQSLNITEQAIYHNIREGRLEDVVALIEELTRLMGQEMDSGR